MPLSHAFVDSPVDYPQPHPHPPLHYRARKSLTRAGFSPSYGARIGAGNSKSDRSGTWMTSQAASWRHSELDESKPWARFLNYLVQRHFDSRRARINNKSEEKTRLSAHRRDLGFRDSVHCVAPISELFASADFRSCGRASREEWLWIPVPREVLAYKTVFAGAGDGFPVPDFLGGHRVFLWVKWRRWNGRLGSKDSSGSSSSSIPSLGFFPTWKVPSELSL